MNRPVFSRGFWLGVVPSLALAIGLPAPGVQAQVVDAAAQLQQQRAACQQIANDGSREACLREAAAAAAERQKGNGLTQPTEAQQRANALRRCDRLPEPQRADCMRLRQSPDVQVQGSVQGGGVFRELRIIEYGAPVPADSVPASPGAATSPAVPSAAPLPPGVTSRSQPVSR